MFWNRIKKRKTVQKKKEEKEEGK